MVAWKSRTAHQHCGAVLAVPCACLHSVPERGPSHARRHELGMPAFRVHGLVCERLLCLGWKEVVHLAEGEVAKKPGR